MLDALLQALMTPGSRVCPVKVFEWSDQRKRPWQKKHATFLRRTAQAILESANRRRI